MKAKILTPTIFIICLFSQAQEKVMQTDRQISDYFGSSISIYGNIGVVAARGQDLDTNGGSTKNGAGAVYVLEKGASNNWAQKQKLVANDRQVGDLFGTSVAIYDKIIVVGSSLCDTDENGGNYISDAGAAYIFELNNDGLWEQTQKIIASDRSEAAHFGFLVTIIGQQVFLSAPSSFCNSGSGTVDSGSVYVFEKNTGGVWIEKQKLFAFDAQSGDSFGSYISGDSNILLIGAMNEDEDEFESSTKSSAGSAYIFEKDTDGFWTQKQKIIAPDRTVDDNFGFQLSIYDSTIVITTISNSTDASSSNFESQTGSAYIYELGNGGNWEFKQKIVASDRMEVRWFGYATRVFKDMMLISANYEIENSSLKNYGAVYLFEKNEITDLWEETKKILAPDRQVGDEFGYELAISDNYIFATAPYSDKDIDGNNHVTNSGAVYVYNISELLSTKDVSTTLNMTVFPNPTSGVIQLLSNEVMKEIEIIDITGKSLHKEHVNSNKVIVNLSHLAAGIYFANISTNQHNSVVKFVVE